MVNIQITQQIRGAKSDNFEEAKVIFDYQAAFPPTLGMGIRSTRTSPSVVLIGVQYIVETAEYVCYTEPLRLGPKDDPFSFVLSQFIRSGYRRVL